MRRALIPQNNATAAFSLTRAFALHQPGNPAGQHLDLSLLSGNDIG